MYFLRGLAKEPPHTQNKTKESQAHELYRFHQVFTHENAHSIRIQAGFRFALKVLVIIEGERKTTDQIKTIIQKMVHSLGSRTYQRFLTFHISSSNISLGAQNRKVPFNTKRL